MNKTISILFSLFVVLASGCSESETAPSNVNPYSCIVTISGDSVIMTTGAVCSIDFSITSPSTPPPSFSNDSSSYTIELRLADNNATPTDYRLAKVEQINDLGNTSTTSKYRAYIEDLCQKNNYRDQVQLVLRHKTSGTISLSSPFCVKYDLDSLTSSLLDTGLPLVMINTENNEEPICEYVSAPEGCWGQGITNTTKVPGCLEIIQHSDVVYYSGEYTPDDSGMTIKIRGNASAYGEKKPYKIKLQKKADLLNRGNDSMYRDKEWLLLKYDGIRTLVGFKLNELMHMKWTPSLQFVNVMINDDYRGVYMLTESVKRNTECRLNVDKTGFIIEYDAYWWNEEVFFESDWSYSMNYTFKYPNNEDLSKEQIDYIKSQIDSLEFKIKNGEDYEQYIDVESWAKWILALDILGSGDAAGTNLYITKYDNTESSILKIDNLWDFDGNFMNKNMWSTTHTHSIQYFNKLFNNNNPQFIITYKRIWDDTHNEVFTKMSEFLSEFNKTNTASNLDEAIKYDNKRWNTNYQSVSEEIKKAKSWFESRLTFLKENIPNL